MVDRPDDPDPTDRDPTETLPPSVSATRHIGPYRLLQKLGEGGMGVVYEAEQTKPVRRRVALKIIKRGMDTDSVVTRFEAERQALALMNHANVAKVLDAGATAGGRPYFVMELVKGVPITEHCDRLRLDTRGRLELFGQVCAGVQHAHQRGIIHRDIKPSNVLVQTEDGHRVPKIIDFGVAKATQQRLTERTLFTELGQLVGTPEYMSPEQAEMTSEDIDTRTDVYSLGVLLYELLVGALPFDSRELRQGGFDEIRRRIREEEPSRPSARISTLGDAALMSAQSRHTDPSSLVRQLRGDLDWITMKALDKDRTRRYDSPSELSADIHRHLSNEPVAASPPSKLYRVRKFVRRHTVGVGLAAAAVVLLAAFAVTTTVQSRRIAREVETSERVSELLAGMLGDLDPHHLGVALWDDLHERVVDGRRKRGAAEEEIAEALESLDDALSGVNATNAALRMVDEQILAPTARTIERDFAAEPRIAARVLHELGVVYIGLGLFKEAEPLLERAADLRSRQLGDRHRVTLNTNFELASLYWNLVRRDEAEALHLDTLEKRRGVLGEADPDTLRSKNALALLYSQSGRLTEAQPLFVETLQTSRRVLGDDHPDTLTLMNNLALVFLSQGRYADAEELHMETLETRKRVLGEDHRLTLLSMNNLGHLYWTQRRYDDAEPFHVKALEGRRRVLGDDHPLTLSSISNVANLYWNQGRYWDVEPLHIEALATRRRVLGDDHPSTLQSMNDLAYLYWTRKRYAEAEPLYLEALAGRGRVFGDDHRATLNSLNGLALLYKSQGRYSEAETLYLQVLNTRRRTYGDDHAATLNSITNLALLYQSQERHAEAETLHAEALHKRRQVHGDDHRATLRAQGNLALLYSDQGRDAEAQALHLETFEARKRVFGETDPETLRSVRNLANLYKATGRPAEARPFVRILLTDLKNKAEKPQAEPAAANAKNIYAWTLLTCEPADLRDPKTALRVALEANELAKHQDPYMLDTLSVAYHETGETAKAIEKLKEAIARVPETDSDSRADFEKKLVEYEAALETP